MKTILAASILLAAGLIAPAQGYHIDPFPAGAANSPGDWATTGIPSISICESNGPGDDRNAAPAAHGGVGGLCTTGRNDATGALAPASQPLPGTWTRLDMCDAETATRTNTGTVVTGDCSSGDSGSILSNGLSGRTNPHGWSAEIGAYSCFIPTNREAAPIVNADYALYYDELYAWWSIDGSGTYDSTDDTPGAAHGGDGDNPPGTRNRLAAHHGHVTAFPDLSVSEVGASLTGSAEAAGVSFPITALTLSDTDSSASGGLANSCGSSPACPSGTLTCTVPYGPVIRAPNMDNAAAGENPLPVCADVWLGFVRTTYSCLSLAPLLPPVCSLGLPWTIATAGVSFDTTASVGAVAGKLTCGANTYTSGGATPLPTAGDSSYVAHLGLPVAISADADVHLVLGVTGTATATCTRNLVGGDLPSNADTIWAVVCA